MYEYKQLDQQSYMKFCLKLEHSSLETIQMIKRTFRVNSVSEARWNRGNRYFKEGRESVECGPCIGRLSTGRTPKNVEHMWAAINENQFLPVWKIKIKVRELYGILFPRFKQGILTCHKRWIYCVLKLHWTYSKLLTMNQISQKGHNYKWKPRFLRKKNYSKKPVMKHNKELAEKSGKNKTWKTWYGHKQI